MDSENLPAKGLQTRRKADGVLGEVYAIDPDRHTITVRWPTIPGAYAMQACTPEQFAAKWELTGVHLAPPYHSNAAPIIIAIVSLIFLVYVLARNGGTPYSPYGPPQTLTTDSEATLKSAEALDAKYGLTAAQRCAAGADDYIRSFARYRFNWDETGPLENKFDNFEPSVVSPGVLTLTSHKARLSNGFGVFSPIEIFCNYDTQNRIVLNYAARPAEDSIF